MAIPNPNSKRIVIDASVAQSAGDEQKVFPPESTFCREFLKEIRKNGHFAVFSNAIFMEWHKHASGFARTWFIEMVRQTRTIDLGEITNAALRDLVRQAAPDEDIFAILLKDMLLIEAALLADEIVASKDQKSRRHFPTVAKAVVEIANIVWVNPTIVDEDCINWLRQGAPADEERKLGYGIK